MVKHTILIVPVLRNPVKSIKSDSANSHGVLPNKD